MVERKRRRVTTFHTWLWITLFPFGRNANSISHLFVNFSTNSSFCQSALGMGLLTEGSCSDWLHWDISVFWSRPREFYTAIFRHSDTQSLQVYFTIFNYTSALKLHQWLTKWLRLTMEMSRDTQELRLPRIFDSYVQGSPLKLIFNRKPISHKACIQIEWVRPLFLPWSIGKNFIYCHLYENVRFHAQKRVNVKSSICLRYPVDFSSFAWKLLFSP